MKPLIALLYVAILGALLFGCGVPPDLAGKQWIDTTSQAVSILPPDIGTQPWLCSPSTWNPMDTGGHPWPQHGWCQWQPTPGSWFWPYRVWDCSGVMYPGSWRIYDQDNFGVGAPPGTVTHCATILGSPVTADSAGYTFDYDLMQVNGFFNQWTPPGGTQQYTRIKSYLVGPHTSLFTCEGPINNNNGWNGCQNYRSQGTGNSSAVILQVPHVYWSDGLFFSIAAAQIGATSP